MAMNSIIKDGKKYISATKAIEEADRLGIQISKPTIIKWCKIFDLGFQLGGSGGKWYIHPNKFEEYINGRIKNTTK